MLSNIKLIRMYILLAITLTFVSATSLATELLLFVGKSHDVFIGCLSCNKYDSSAVCSRYGSYGSQYSDKSIWSRYGSYGSQYSDTSPWNKYASTPPVIVDREGNFYGYFTANKYQDKRTQIKALLQLTDNVDWVNEDLERARDTFCED